MSDAKLILDDVRGLQSILYAASTKDTCWRRLRSIWVPENPGVGHCVKYAGYIQDQYGGEIMKQIAISESGKTIPHYSNLIDGMSLDFNIHCFPPETTFGVRKVVELSEAFETLKGEKERYSMFLEKLKSQE